MKIYKKIIFLLLIFGSLAAQEKELLFENISTFQGLSDARVKCIFQDSFGYLWFGTFGGGLNRYDGYTFKTYKHKEGDYSSIIDNTIYSIAEDAENNLWIGTDYGLSHYIQKEGKFKRYNLYKQFKEIKELTNNSVYEVFTDSKQRIWFGTAQLGALRYDKDNDKLISIRKQTADTVDVFPWGSSDFTEDQNGVIWAASTAGLIRYDEKNDLFQKIPVDLEDVENLNERDIFRIYADSENNIWLMTTSDLYKYSPSTKKLIHLLNYKISVPNYANNYGYEGEMWEDTEGNMWVVHINLPHPVQFPKLSNEYFEFDSENISATDIYIDLFGALWVSDWANGLYKHVPKRQSFYQAVSKIGVNEIWIGAICQSIIDSNIIYLGASIPGWLSYNKITGNIIQHKRNNTLYTEAESKMIANKDGTLWIGSWGGGLAKWNQNTDELVLCFNDSLVTPNLYNGRIGSLEKDLTGALWIGTYEGLYRLSPDESKLDSILATQGAIALCLDGDILWIGTHGAGLLKYDINNNSTLTIENNESLSNLIIWDIHKDKDGILWLATAVGLLRFDPKEELIEVYDESDGFENDFIVSILPGDNGEFWMSTASGISSFNKDSLNLISIANYDSHDGLLFTDFRYTSAFKDSNGRMYFGGAGLNYFTPKSYKTIAPRFHISELAVNGKSFLKSKNSNLADRIDENGSLELKYDQNTISIGFVAIQTVEAKKNRCAYFLEGYDTDWISTEKRQVQYINLEPGNYKFHLRGVNQDGIWSSEELILPIIISPPFWKTWWAYSFYLVMFFGVLYSIRKFELNRQMKNSAIKESQLRAEAAEFQAKAAEAQSRVIQAENERKTQELEEARKLQLSMLPKELPKIENLDIAVYMKTATEVGGDYYDFSIKDDGSLNIALGDATGHGMKAGTLVSMIKSLFVANSINKSLEEFFFSSNEALKNSKLNKMMMAFAMVNIRADKIEISNAGIPPIYIYRKAKMKVEEVKLSGLPLGAMKQTKYDIYKSEVFSGDTILILSDGFPELQNIKEELYGYDRVVKSFKNAAEKSPDEIIDYLKDESSKWVKDKDPDDDVTFVVIKVK